MLNIKKKKNIMKKIIKILEEMKKEINIINLLYEFKKNKNIKNLYLEIEELKANNEIEQENIKGLKDKISQIKTNLFEI